MSVSWLFGIELKLVLGLNFTVTGLSWVESWVDYNLTQVGCSRFEMLWDEQQWVVAYGGQHEPVALIIHAYTATCAREALVILHTLDRCGRCGRCGVSTDPSDPGSNRWQPMAGFHQRTKECRLHCQNRHAGHTEVYINRRLYLNSCWLFLSTNRLPFCLDIFVAKDVTVVSRWIRSRSQRWLPFCPESRRIPSKDQLSSVHSFSFHHKIPSPFSIHTP